MKDLVRKLGSENERLRIALQKIAHPSRFIFAMWNRPLSASEGMVALEATDWATKIAQETLGEKPEKKEK